MWTYPDGTSRDSGTVAAQGEAFIQEPTKHAQKTLEDQHVIVVRSSAKSDAACCGGIV